MVNRRLFKHRRQRLDDRLSRSLTSLAIAFSAAAGFALEHYVQVIPFPTGKVETVVTPGSAKLVDCKERRNVRPLPN